MIPAEVPHMPSTRCTAAVIARLQSAGIQTTRQRIAIGQVLLRRPVHMTADDILVAARALLPTLARATVYNTLSVFVEKGLLRVLRLNPEHTVYDSRTEAHSHLYHEDTGQVQDCAFEGLPRSLMPHIPPHLEVVGVDLMVRVRPKACAIPSTAPTD